MKQVIVGCLILLLVSGMAYSQRKGYVGRIHHLQTDVAGILMGGYRLEYKLSVGKHLALAATAGFQRKEVSLSGKSGWNYYTQSSESLSSASFSGALWGLGIAYNSPWAGMSMPIGFYCGLYYQRLAGTMQEHQLNGQLWGSFRLKSNIYKFYFGKSLVLYRFFTLDAGVGLGFAAGSLTSEDSKKHPTVILPSYSIFAGSVADEYLSGSSTERSFLKFYCLPEVKLGYIF